MINKETKIYCSFSSNPGNNGCVFFNSEFKELNMNAIYKSFYSDDIKKSIEAVKSLGIKGFALSMPFKIEALDYVDEVEDSARKIGSINTVVNKDGYLKGYNTDWVGVKKYFKKNNFDLIYIIGNGGFSKAIQYTCNVMGIRFEVITRENWNIIEELEDKIIFNATPVDVKTDNFLIDGRPYTDTGREIALYQAKEQFKIYTGVEID
ncbi:hypothetical protein HOE22_01095 [Candidatus Woesearchaeota archaeon]|jgi:shikimate dehydrogenase|nr:hypothetical protein [Candidatus Woesearchaeota archaeon]